MNLILVQEAILRLHPDLAGRLAESGALTKESAEEQKFAGLNEMTREEKQSMKALNHL